jgi:hypothetical protein
MCNARSYQLLAHQAGVDSERDHYRAALASMKAKRDELFEEATEKGRELARRDAMRCITCRHQEVSDLRSIVGDGYVDVELCTKHEIDANILCADMGGGCRAWEGR